MQTYVDINPLKPGKLEAYKKFSAEITGPRKADFADLLSRYGLKTANSSYHTINDVTFIVVAHTAEDDAHERLKNFGTSKHPMDQWFVEQLTDLHDFSPLNGAGQTSHQLFYFQPEVLLK